MFASKKYLPLFLTLVILAIAPPQLRGQCTWNVVDLEDFEYSTNCPDLVTPLAVNSAAPWSNPHYYNGGYYLYMNFVDLLPPNSLVYERFYTVCPNQQYRISCWFKGLNNSFSNITLNVVDANGVILDTWTGVSVNGIYLNYISNPVVPATNSISFQLISHGAPGNNDMAFDYLSLSSCSPPAEDEGTILACQSAGTVNLHDSLSVVTATNGVWSGPSALANGFQGTFDPNTNVDGVYTYTSSNGTNCADSVAFFNVVTTLAPNLSTTNITRCSSFGADITTAYIDSNTTGGAVSYWQDALATIPEPNPSNITTAGTYYIMMSSGGCVDTASVSVSFTPLPAIDLGQDTLLCHNQTLVLDAGAGFDHYLWNDVSTNQTLTVNSGGTYSVQGFVRDSTNLIVNGDFEAGNTGFTTGYVIGTGGAWGPISNQGEYLVTTNPNLAHTNFPVCADHTSGTGNMMVVNGANVINQDIWCQTVPVSPNTDYEFSTWVQNYFIPPAGAAAQLSFFINGVQVGNTFSMAAAGCAWQNFFELWNSGTATSASICITNQNALAAGNDFGLDDISFSPLCVSSDTILVTNNPGPVVTVPLNASYCVGDAVPPSAYSSTPAGASYEWWHSNTAVGLTQLNGSSTAGTPNTPGFTTTNVTFSPDTTTVSVIPTLNSCPGDTVDYLIIVQPMIPTPTADTVLICVNNTATLTATAPGGTYEWYTDTVGGTLLATGNSYTTSSLIADTSFWVQTTLNGCTSPRTKVYVLVGQGISADAGLDVDICPGATATLVATPNVISNTYNWSAPGTPTIDTFATQPVTPTDTTTYTVLITDIYGCTATDSITVNVKPTPVAIVPTDSTYCAGDTVPSSVYSSIPAGASYTWTNSHTAIGLGASGSGNAPKFVTNNPTPFTTNATIAVTPTYLGCVGAAVNHIVTVYPLPTLATPPSKNYCVGDVVPATNIAGTPTGVTFDWINSDTTIALGASGTQNLPAFMATNPTTFAITSVITLSPTANGCVGNPSNYSINVAAPIIIDRIITHPTCFQSTDGKVVAIPSGGTPGYSYSWDTGITDSVVTNLPTGPATLTVTDANNCTQDSVFAIIEPDSIDYISFSASPRAGCSPLEVNFINTTDPNLADKYTWEFGNNLVSDTNWLASSTYTTPGSYDVSLTIVDYFGCSNKLTVANFITVFEDPEAHFKTSPENPTMLNSTIEFTDNSYPNVVAWEWYFDTLGVSASEHPDFTFPEDSGSYYITLIVEDENTCRDTVTRKVLIKSDFAVFFPNSFTPNGDDLNDVFAPKGFGVDLVNYNLIIFNRWGELVFETHTFLEGWDGTYEGEMSPSGAYIWKLEFSDLNGKDYQRTGQVKILR